MTQQIFYIIFQSLELGEAIRFVDIDERFKNIELIPINEKKHKLVINNVDSEEKANLIVEEFIDRISIIDSHQVSNVQYVGATIDNAMSVSLTGSSALSASLTTKIANPLSFYNLAHNKKALTNANHSGAVKVYRHSLSINDNISKYLIYYGLLQLLVSDSQKELERYIKQKIPTITIKKRKMFLNKKEKEIEETVIIRTRNLIAHPNSSLELNSLSMDVNKNINDLRQLVLNILRNE